MPNTTLLKSSSDDPMSKYYVHVFPDLMERDTLCGQFLKCLGVGQVGYIFASLSVEMTTRVVVVVVVVFS